MEKKQYMLSMIRERKGCEKVESDLFSLLVKACEDDDSPAKLDDSELMGEYLLNILKPPK